MRWLSPESPTLTIFAVLDFQTVYMRLAMNWSGEMMVGSLTGRSPPKGYQALKVPSNGRKPFEVQRQKGLTAAPTGGYENRT